MDRTMFFLMMAAIAAVAGAVTFAFDRPIEGVLRERAAAAS